MKSKIILFIIISLVAVPIVAQDTINFRTTDGSSILTKENITPLPDTISKPFIAIFDDEILEIGDGEIINVPEIPIVNFESMFYENQYIVEAIGKNIIKIGMVVFMRCHFLKSINFPKVTTLESSCFGLCKSLESIYLPKLITMGYDCFSSCHSLKSVSFPNVDTIEYGAFYGCTSLVSVDIPNVVYNTMLAFIYCSSLESINFPKSIYFGHMCFESCYSLREITLGTEFTEPTEIKMTESSLSIATFYNTKTENINLNLGEYVLPKKNGYLWNTYNWKNITGIEEGINNKYIYCIGENMYMLDNIDKVELYDITGKLIKTYNHESVIDLNNLINGFYFLTYLNKKNIKTEKIIKK